MEKKNDQAFIATMKELETEPKDSLLNQGVKQEYWLITISAISLILAWFLSYQLLSHLNLVLFYFLAMCNAICIDYLFGEIALRLFSRL